eukprot:792162-Rhodomonas_salina.2
MPGTERRRVPVPGTFRSTTLSKGTRPPSLRARSSPCRSARVLPASCARCPGADAAVGSGQSIKTVFDGEMHGVGDILHRGMDKLVCSALLRSGSRAGLTAAVRAVRCGRERARSTGLGLRRSRRG